MSVGIDNPMSHVVDHPWIIGGRPVAWMSAQIAVMILVGVFLALVLPALARRRRGMVPGGVYHVVEIIVLFVRERIARPALGDRADRYTPYLATLLVFLLGANLAGLLPLLPISEAAGLSATPVGGTPTGSLYVTGGMAATTLLMILAGGYVQSVRTLWKGRAAPLTEHARPRAGMNLFMAVSDALQRRRWPLPVAVVAAVPVWLNGFVPAVPGVIGLILWPLLLVLEVIGYVARCAALCIRLFASMTAGHVLVAVLVGLIAACRGWSMAYASLPGAVGIVGLMFLEIMVAGIQAFIFTLLSALFIGMGTGGHV